MEKRSQSVFMPALLTTLLVSLILSSGIESGSDNLEILINSPETAYVRQKIYFDIIVEAGGKTVEKAVLTITNPLGFSISCELKLVDGGLAYAEDTYSYVKVRTECVPDEYGYGYVVKYIFHVEWKTPKTPETYTIGMTVDADGDVFTESETIELLPWPVVKSFTVSPNPFSPNGDGIKDTTKIRATFNVVVNWELQVRTMAGVVKRTWKGTGNFSIVWDGKDKDGTILADGAYNLRLNGSDLYGTPFRTKWKTVTIDTTPPTITGVTDSPDPFNPKIGQTTTISYTLSEKCTVTIKIVNPSGKIVRTLKKTQLAGANSMIWDGKTGGGVIVSDGTYTYRIYVVDMAGNKAAPYPATGTVTVKST